MSTSAATSSFNLPDLFSINGRLVPIVIVLSGLLFSGLSALCVLSAFNHRRLRIIANDPRTIALARERARLKEEGEKGLPIPKMTTVNVEIDLEVGEQGGQPGWRTVMPLNLEFIPDYSTPPPYDDDKTKVGNPVLKQEKEPEYVRLTVLVALPSASRRRYGKDDVILDATLADSQGRPLNCVQHGFPEAVIGIYQEKYTDGAP